MELLKQPGLEREMRIALMDQNFYNPHNVFHHDPDFYSCTDDRYVAQVHIVKWNSRSTRVIELWARKDEKTGKWIFARKPGVRRTPHGEKMR